MSIMDYLTGADWRTTLSPIRPLEDVYDKLYELSSYGTEITVTYRPEIQDNHESEKLTYFVHRELAKYKCNVILIGEYSPTGMYHMHGSIYAAPTTLKKIRLDLNRGCGRTEVKMIRFIEGWTEYCMKEDVGKRSGKRLERHGNVTSSLRQPKYGEYIEIFNKDPPRI